MGHNQIGKEIAIIPFGGKDKFQRLAEFLNYINYFDTKAIVIADGHQNILDFLADLHRGKLNFRDIIREEGKEFEDLFDSKTIICAMTKVKPRKSIQI
jgi:hypothetical protein